MNKKMRVLKVSIISGIILTFIRIFMSYTLEKNNLDLTAYMTEVLIKSDIIIGFILMVGLGLFAFRDMTRKEIFKSAIIVAIIYGVLFILENIAINSGNYPTILSILFIPMTVYSSIFNFLINILDFNIVVATIVSILSPMIYTIFGSKVYNNL